MPAKYHYNVEQGSEEWHKLRTGILTASEIKLILTPSLQIAKNDKVRSHVYEIAAQRANNYTEPHYISDDMLRGKGDEVYARELYSDKYAPVIECGFVTREIGGITYGYSPDGLVGDDGLIEVKSRRQKYQMETICKNEVPDEFMLQIQSGLLITERKWCDFISYCGGMPMFVKRVYPDVDIQEAIIQAGANFELSVLEMIKFYELNSKDLQPTERIIEEEMVL